jgi:imidazolonepropionase-like amidohydrolase
VIAEGKIADVIAMPGDPFTDIEVTGRVDFVMKEGVIYKDPGSTARAPG